jgi:threonine/homoserine efflux transporter RhtA
LLIFAALAFAGAGVAFAMARAREVTQAESDRGMQAVAILLCLFGGACAFEAVGVAGIFAFGGVIAWFCYVVAARRIGVFRIEQPSHYAEAVAERRRIA